MFLSVLLAWAHHQLAERVGNCPRAIDVTEEQLLLTRAQAPIGQDLASQPPECSGESGLCLLEPVSAQPGVRRKSCAFLERDGALEV
jgi:hypothetical protein